MERFTDQIARLADEITAGDISNPRILMLKEYLKLFQKFGYNVLAEVEDLFGFLSGKKRHILTFHNEPGFLTFALAVRGFRFYSLHQEPETVAAVEAILEKLNLRPFPEFQVSELKRLPFPERSLDYVLSFHLMRTLEDPLPLLQEVERIVKPDGVIIIKDFNRNGIKLYRKMMEEADWLPQPVGISLLEVAEYFDRRDKYISCLREEFDTTLLVTATQQNILSKPAF